MHVHNQIQQIMVIFIIKLTFCLLFLIAQIQNSSSNIKLLQYNIFTNFILKSILETSTSTSDAASSCVFHLDPPPIPTDTDVMDTETSGMQSKSTCTSSRAGTTPSDKITEVGSSGISTGPQSDETECNDEQQQEERLLDQAQAIIDEGYVKLVHLNKLLRKQPDSDDNVYHPDM